MRISSHLHQLAGLRVDAGEGLVHQQDLGLGRERPGQRHALLHAAGQLVRVGVGEAARARPARDSARPARGALGRGDAVRPRARSRRWPRPSPRGSAGRTGTRSRSAAPGAGAAPSTSTSPPSGAIRPLISRSSVVLPQPLGPTRLTKLSRSIVERRRPRAPPPAAAPAAAERLRHAAKARSPGRAAERPSTTRLEPGPGRAPARRRQPRSTRASELEIDPLVEADPTQVGEVRGRRRASPRSPRARRGSGRR